MADPLLEVDNLSISFTRYTRGLRQHEIEVIHQLSLSIDAGQIVAVVGSSGSGKSLLAHAIMGILPDNARVTGAIRYEGEALDAVKLAHLRGNELVLVPQSVSYLDPLMQVGAQVHSSVNRSGKGRLVGGQPMKQRKQRREEQRQMFDRYHLAPGVERQYPFQLSGGMARRVLLSTATIGGARLIVADEPTPGLDDRVAQEALRQLKELADEGCAILLISHDLDSVLPIAHEVAVFYAGTVVELAPACDFAGEGQQLRHPYSQALWRALPQNDFSPIPGSQPLPGFLPPGCLFAPRCPLASDECTAKHPELRELRNGQVRCIHAT